MSSASRSFRRSRAPRPRVAPPEVRRSDLSASWRAFLDACRQVRFGSLHKVGIWRGEPGTGPGLIVSRTVKVPGDRDPLPAADDPDYAVRREVLDLIDLARRLDTGTIDRIDVAGGLPKAVHLHGEWAEVMRA